MLRRNVDLIAVTFLLAFVLAGSVGGSLIRRNQWLFDFDRAHMREIRPHVMEIRREVREAEREMREGAAELRKEACEVHNEVLRTRDEVREEIRRVFRIGQLRME